VRLTRAGTALVERIHEPLLDHNRAMCAHMSRPDLERLAALQESLLEALV
jgi:hypothetical protein